MSRSDIKKNFAMVIWVSLFTIVCWTGSDAAGTGKAGNNTIKIAAAFAKTGKWAAWEKPFYDVLAYAADELNSKGGLLGKKIEILELDSQSTIAGAKLIARQAVDSGVLAVIGTSGSSSAMALAPILQEAGILMITPIATSPEVTRVGDYIFRVCFIDPFQGSVMANFAIQDLGVKKAVVLTNTSNSYSVGLSKVFMEQFQKRGGRLLWEGEYIQDTYDYKQILDKTNSLAPDAVFLPGYQKDSARVIKQARNKGITKTFLGGDAWSDIMYDLGGEAIHGCYYTNHWHRGASFPESRQFLDAYEKQRDKVKHPAFALAYDAVMVFAHAVEKSKSTLPSQVRNTLAALKDYPGVTGKITFDSNRNPIKPAVILKFEKKSSVYVKAVDP
jgi:branched-chain amino acid transport system substrate-binding protein